VSQFGDWVAVAGFAWGVIAIPVGIWIGRKSKAQDTLPNIRPNFGGNGDFFRCVADVHARTNEDILITKVSASADLCVTGDRPIYDVEGSITGYNHEWQPSPVSVDWLVPGGGSSRFFIDVRSPTAMDIRLTLSSSARTLIDRRVTIKAPTNP